MKKLILFLVFYYSLFIPNYSLRSQWLQMSNGKKLEIDTITIKYFPLAAGNVYKYHYANSNFQNYDYKVRIIKDTIINAKRYFKANITLPGYIGGFLRCDTITGNIYSRASEGYCYYSPFESLVDSLKAKKGDTTFVCTPYVPRHYCIDTGFASLFGNQIKKKVFYYNTSETSTTVTYGYNFGIISAFYSDFWGMAAESLIGCYINGILYGDTTLTDIQIISSKIPSSFSLFQNYPNPFNPNTIIRFQIKDSRFVSLKVYNILGKEIITLVNEKLNAGTYEIPFSINHLPRQANNQTPSGVYFYRLITDGFSETRKMVILK